MKGVNGGTGSWNNNTINDGEFYPVETGLQQCVKDNQIFRTFASRLLNIAIFGIGHGESIQTREIGNLYKSESAPALASLPANHWFYSNWEKRE